VKDKIHYICIDKRIKDTNGSTYIILENSQKILLPPTVTKVPALLLLTQGHHVLFGQQIYQHLQPTENSFSSKIDNTPNEPTAFAIRATGGVASDTFSFLDQDADSMTAKGDGGLRQMHQYASLNFEDKINTPPDNYEPNTIGNDGMSIEQIQAQRNKDVPKNLAPI
tara:strand:- start:12 stop:512 length:501 start_codon:yes stop_codon:yes gene_type:complete